MTIIELVLRHMGDAKFPRIKIYPSIGKDNLKQTGTFENALFKKDFPVQDMDKLIENLNDFIKIREYGPSKTYSSGVIMYDFDEKLGQDNGIELKDFLDSYFNLVENRYKKSISATSN